MYSYNISINITQNHFHSFIFWHLAWLYSRFPGGLDSKESACHSGEPGSTYHWLSGRESACQAGDMNSIPGSERSPGEGNGNPLQNSFLGNPMDRGPWWATVHGVTKILTRLSD